MSASVEIAGAGPSGLAAGIAVAENGGRARVLERRSGVGMRFHGDFQGLENWSTERDVLVELHEMGIEPTFEHTPFRECVFYDPHGREHLCRSTQPIWYLVRRGTEEGSLDRSLERQAVAAGVTIEHEHLVQHHPEGGIVAHGPRRVDAIAVGYVFETDRADGAFAAVSDEIAPGGYAYLLICGGRATVATCMFDDFHNDKLYLSGPSISFDPVLASHCGTSAGSEGSATCPRSPICGATRSCSRARRQGSKTRCSASGCGTRWCPGILRVRRTRAVTWTGTRPIAGSVCLDSFAVHPSTATCTGEEATEGIDIW